MNLKDIRTKHGVSQKTVADALGCSTTVYSRYETGSRQPPLETLIALADFYQMSLDELVGRTPMEVVVKHETPPPKGDDVVRLQFSLDDAPEDENELENAIRKIVAEEFSKRGL